MPLCWMVMGPGIVHQRDLGVSDALKQRLASFADLPITAHLLLPGDHLVARRFFGLYTHHGVYVGQHQVIHYAPAASESQKARVQLSSLNGFSHGSRLYRRRYIGVRKGDRHTVVARAKSCLGEAEYALLNNNCEHFAEWCVRGERSSAQVERRYLTAFYLSRS